jgi:hypothetical protein
MDPVTHHHDAIPIAGYAVRLTAKPGTYDAGNTYVLAYTFRRFKYEAVKALRAVRKWAAKGHTMDVVKVTGEASYRPPKE